MDSEERMIWRRMLESAGAVQHSRRISDYVEAGGVAAAVESSTGKIYTGVCVDAACALGICAERNAIFNMLTNGEHRIRRVLAVMPDGKSSAPCGACRELMAQLMPHEYGKIEVMLDFESMKIVRMAELAPEWWIK